jgi:hypothetical protein
MDGSPRRVGHRIFAAWLFAKTGELKFTAAR